GLVGPETTGPPCQLAKLLRPTRPEGWPPKESARGNRSGLAGAQGWLSSSHPLCRCVAPRSRLDGGLPSPAWQRYFFTSTSLPLTNRSGGSTSSKTTHTASLGRCVTSAIAVATRLAILVVASRSSPHPLDSWMFTKGSESPWAPSTRSGPTTNCRPHPGRE